MNKYHSLVIIILFSTPLVVGSDTNQLASYRVAAALQAIKLPPSIISIMLEYGQWFFITGKPTTYDYPFPGF